MQKLYHHPESDSTFLASNLSGPDFDYVDEVDDVGLLPAGTVIEGVGLSRSTVVPSMDFETRSEAGYVINHDTGKVASLSPGKKGGLPLVGTPVYAEHPSTQVISLAYNLKDGRGEQLWIEGMPPPRDLCDHIANGGMIEAWNVTFEWWIWNMVCSRRMGWPVLPLDQCVCVMARSRRFSLPGSLGKAASVLGVEDKDKEGGRLINLLTRPHSLTKSRRSFWRTPANSWPEFEAFYRYNVQDVRTEDQAAARIPDLTPVERDQWLLDQTINARGVQVDVASLDAMLDILEQTERAFTMELANITGGAVGSVSEVDRFLKWLDSQGVHMPDLQAETVKGRLTKIRKSAEIIRGERPDAHPIDVEDAPKYAAHAGGAVERALEIRQALGSANVKKLRTLKLQLSSDGRLRDQYLYCGADRTGRASAGGVQLQNITAKGPKSQECGNCGRITGLGATLEVMGIKGACPNCGANEWTERPEWTVEAVEYALADIATRDLRTVVGLWGDPVTVLCGCLRGIFTASTGKTLVCVDFSAIEAVAAACLARCQWRIDVFATHGKIYEMSAANITGTPLEVYLDYKKQNGMHHPDRKKIGKVAELASGYGGWIGAWKAFGATQTDDELKELILAWRAASPEIVDMWGGQYRHVGPGKWDYTPELYGLEGMAIKAIQNPGQCFHVIDISYAVYNDILFCRLPSGRFLHYHKPRLVPTEDKLKRDYDRGQRIAQTWSITFEGYNSNAAKGPVGWQVLETYGGRLFENVVQAVSADIQFAALGRAERAGYPIVMHTHDEGCAEVPEGFGSVEELCAVFAERPAWASWWPLKAAGWTHKRYQKD